MAYRTDEQLYLLYLEMDERWKKDPWRWACDQVMTIDESVQQTRPWPAHKTYLRETMAILRGEPVVVIPKSRQMMISWLIALYFTHKARYFDDGAWFWVSAEERKAAFAVDRRCLFIEEHLRFPEARQKPRTIKTKLGMVGRLTYANNSFIWAFPQNPDALRMYTASGIMIDESEFQRYAPDGWRSAIPLVQNGAQLIVVSSSNGPTGLIAEFCRDIGFFSWRDYMRLVA